MSETGYYRIIEITATFLIPPLIIFNSIFLGDHMLDQGAIILVGSIIFLGILAGDMLTGLVHWFCDTFGNEDIPFFGPNIIKPFRDHHTDPQDITRHDFFETNGNSCLLGAFVNTPVIVCILAINELSLTLSSVLLFISVMSLAACMANQVHKLSHSKKPNAFARLLQKGYLILNPKMHARHHKAPHLNNYCISFGWLNPLLDRIRFFRIAEKMLEFLGLQKTN